jgi:hypothetical protein
MLTSFAEGVWLASDPVRIVGTHLTATMTVLRLAAGALAVYSPTSLSVERRAQIERLGRVEHLIAPNVFHHTWLGDWSTAFPSARVHAPAGLSKKRPELRIDRALDGEGEAAFEGSLDEVHVDGFRLDETAIVHRASGTLIVADLFHNVGTPQGAWTKLYTRMMGFYDRVALSKALQMTAFSDRKAARRSIDRLLGLPFERAVVGHGTPLTSDAKAGLKAAYAWLA